MQAEAARPFDLSRELFRVWLYRLSAEEHILLVMQHHIIGRLVRKRARFSGDLSAFYTAYQEGRLSPLPELEVQYADYALWQREWLRARSWSGRSPTGGSSCVGCRRRWNCRPTGRDRRRSVIKARGSLAGALQRVDRTA